MDTRIREDIFPIRIVESAGNIENAVLLTEPTDLQIGTSETHLVHITGKAHILLDFGKEYNGGVRFLTFRAAGDNAVHIRCGESVSEANSVLGEKGSGNYHTLRDVTEHLLDYSDMRFLETGFRFVRIDFGEGADVWIKAITAVYEHRDLTPIGSFTCNDDRVNEIFSVAARTLMLNMQRYIWDGIKRDRLVWIGDMYPETMGIIDLFGQDDSVIESLEYARVHTPLPGWMNTIATYSMWWVIILADYYRHNGDASYIAAQRAYIDGVVRQIDGIINEDGSISVLNECLFDWPSHEKADEEIGVVALCYLAATRAKELFRVLGLDTSVCDRMQEKLRKYSRTSVECKQCEAMKVYARLMPAVDAAPFLTAGGATGLSTFMSYYILDAIAQAGKPDEAVSIMKTYYGAMLDKGATSFWENFDMEWVNGTSRIDAPVSAGEKDIHGDFGDFCYVGFRHSLCHGWSCGPVPFLMNTIGGIEILETGCKTVRVNPVAAGLSFYEIKYPTPLGTIDISLRDGKFTVVHPKKIKLQTFAGRTDIKVKKK